MSNQIQLRAVHSLISVLWSVEKQLYVGGDCVPFFVIHTINGIINFAVKE